MLSVRHWHLEPAPLPLIWVAAGAVVATASAGAIATGDRRMMLAGFGLVAATAVAYLATWTRPSTFVSLMLAGTLVSGHSNLIGLPISPDRILLVAAVGALVVRLPGVVIDRRIEWRSVHVLIALVVAYAIVNALAAGTLTTSAGFFAILDRLGVVPMLAFVLAPLLFADARARSTLLAVLVCVGAYLALTAFAEELHLHALVWPKYIVDSTVGIHFGRVRGPFVEAVAMGLALYECAVAGVVAIATWQSRTARVLAGVVVAADLVATLFTLTRSVWLATVGASALAALMSQSTRRFLVRGGALAAIALIASLALIPSLGDHVATRTSDRGPVWERYATNAAAVRAVRAHPLFGVGWQRWTDVSADYLRQGRDYPLTRSVANIEVHNVPLSHAAELGLVGGVLWLAAIAAAVGTAVLRPGPASLDPWRLGMVAIAVHWAVVAALGPLGYAFPNLLLWLWAGITGSGHLSRPLDA